MSRIFCCGDLHGDAYNIAYLIAQINNPIEEDNIIVCGDAGFEYGKNIQIGAKDFAMKFPGS